MEPLCFDGHAEDTREGSSLVGEVHGPSPEALGLQRRRVLPVIEGSDQEDLTQVYICIYIDTYVHICIQNIYIYVHKYVYMCICIRCL